ncbi:MAG: hypothetical protein ACFFCY_02900 [Promethearchaeota archaeon]
MSNSKRISGFREDLCNLYGECFHLCPVLNLSINEEKKEIKNLINVKKSEYTLVKCYIFSKSFLILMKILKAR